MFRLYRCYLFEANGTAALAISRSIDPGGGETAVLRSTAISELLESGVCVCFTGTTSCCGASKGLTSCPANWVDLVEEGDLGDLGGDRDPACCCRGDLGDLGKCFPSFFSLANSCIAGVVDPPLAGQRVSPAKLAVMTDLPS